MQEETKSAVERAEGVVGWWCWWGGCWFWGWGGKWWGLWEDEGDGEGEGLVVAVAVDDFVVVAVVANEE